MNKPIPTSTLAALLLGVLAAVGFMASIASAAPQETPEPGFAWTDGAEVYTNFTLESSGRPVVLSQAIDALAIRGGCGIVGTQGTFP